MTSLGAEKRLQPPKPELRKRYRGILCSDPLRNMRDLNAQDLQEPFEEMVSYWAGRVLKEGWVPIYYGHKQVGRLHSTSQGYLAFRAPGEKLSESKFPYRPCLEDLFAVFLTGYYGHIFSDGLFRASHDASSYITGNPRIQHQKYRRLYITEFLQRRKCEDQDIVMLGETGKALTKYPGTWRKSKAKTRKEKQHKLLAASLLLGDCAQGYQYREEQEMRKVVKEHCAALYEKHKGEKRLFRILNLIDALKDVKRNTFPGGIYLGLPAVYCCLDDGKNITRYKNIFRRLHVFREHVEIIRKCVIIFPTQERQEEIEKKILESAGKYEIPVKFRVHPIASIPTA